MIESVFLAVALRATSLHGLTTSLMDSWQEEVKDSLTIARYQPTLTVETSAKSDYLRALVLEAGTPMPSIMATLLPGVPVVQHHEDLPLSMIGSSYVATVTRLQTTDELQTPGVIAPQLSSQTFFSTLMAPMSQVTENKAAQPFAQPVAEPVFIGDTKLVSLALASTPLESVISLISKQIGVNIVLLAKPEQKVTINVREMSLMEAMRHLAAISGLRVIKVKNTLVMAEEAMLKTAYPKDFEKEYGGDSSSVKTTSSTAEPLVAKEITRVINTRFQSATQLTQALKEFFLTRKVTIVALPNTMVPSIDGGSGIQSSSGITSGSLNTDRGQNESGSRRVLLSGPEKSVEEAVAMIEQLDIPREQVEITVTIHDVANDALKEEGFSWNFGQFTVSEQSNNSVNFGTFGRSGLSFGATMKALEQQDRAKLLASPNVSVMDGQRAFVLIGERRQFPIVSGTTSTGQFIFSTQEQNIGIYLQVAADVASDGTITLAVKPQVSAIIGFLQVNGGNYPQVSTRESQSTLTLKDGQTMLLAGLLRDEEVRNLEQVPLLSKIPIFGELFKSRRTSKRSSQLVISITPHIVKK
jgi:Flp pilus assembly secretin CpaC